MRETLKHPQACPRTFRSFTKRSNSDCYNLPPGGCLMMGDFFPSARDKKVKPDKCSICTCFNETSHCVKRTCPVLECSAEHQIYRSGECCPTCPDLMTELASSTCTYKGVTYQVCIIAADAASRPRRQFITRRPPPPAIELPTTTSDIRFFFPPTPAEQSNMESRPVSIMRVQRRRNQMRPSPVPKD